MITWLHVLLVSVGAFFAGYALGIRRRSVPSPPSEAPVRLIILVGPLQEEVPMLTIKATQKVRLSIVPKDAEGNPTQAENPVFAVSDPSVGSFDNFSVDGMSCDFLAGTPTTGQVNVSADGIVGAGEAPLFAVLDVTVVPGDAALLEIATGAPEDQ